MRDIGLLVPGQDATNHVVSRPDFEHWIHEQQLIFAPATKALPKYSKTYVPEPTRRGE